MVDEQPQRPRPRRRRCRSRPCAPCGRRVRKAREAEHHVGRRVGVHAEQLAHGEGAPGGAGGTPVWPRRPRRAARFQIGTAAIAATITPRRPRGERDGSAPGFVREIAAEHRLDGAAVVRLEALAGPSTASRARWRRCCHAASPSSRPRSAGSASSSGSPPTGGDARPFRPLRAARSIRRRDVRRRALAAGRARAARPARAARDRRPVRLLRPGLPDRRRSWQLFAVWAALALPLCLAARSDVLWAPWALVAMTGISLWVHAHTGHRWRVQPDDLAAHLLGAG